MRPLERQSQIIDLVRSRGSVSVEELCAIFSTSAETIRRDLARLSRAGEVQKVHGGAILPRVYGEGSFEYRLRTNEPAKLRIAQKARELVTEGDSLFIDTGTTTLVFAEALPSLHALTVVTNSSEIANVIKTRNAAADVFLLGGNYCANNRQTAGPTVISQLGEYRCKLAILTVGALCAPAGAMDYSYDEAMVAKAMHAGAEQTVLLVDSSKFDQNAPFVVTPFENVTAIVCDEAPTGLLADALKVAGVRVIA